jgi:hypothetical protein
MMRLPGLGKILTLLALAAIANPALAGLVYTWQDAGPLNGTGATGMVEFADGVELFDESNDVLAFWFTTSGVGGNSGHTYDKSFAFEALGDVAVGGEFLCFSSCDVEKVAREAARKDTFLLFGRAGPDNSDLDWLAAYEAIAAQTVDSPVNESGLGRWVRVPEPPALYLLFAGLGLIGLVRKRAAGR